MTETGIEEIVGDFFKDNIITAIYAYSGLSPADTYNIVDSAKLLNFSSQIYDPIVTRYVLKKLGCNLKYLKL
jgi:hypothetical protein